MNKLYLYLFLLSWSIYYLQGTFYAAGDRLAMFSLFVGLLLCVAGWYKAHQTYKLPGMMNTTSLLLVMFAFYGIVLMASGTQIFRSFDHFQYSGARYITSVFSSLSPVFVSYFFTRQGILKEQHLKILFFVFLAICIARFWSYETIRVAASTFDTGGMTTNNIAYDFLGLLPMICVFKKKPWLQYAALVVILFFVIYGVKRGAIFVTMVCSAIFFLKNLSGGRRMVVLVFTVLAIAGGYYIIDYMLTTNDYFVSRVDRTFEGDSSGRDEYFLFFWNYLMSITDFVKLLFGGGAFYTVVINGNLAHNDWLEILCCNGLLGFVIFAVYWYRFYMATRETKGLDIHLPLLLLFVSMFLKTFFSMSYSSTPLYASFYMGYCLALLSIRTKNIRLAK